MAPTLFIMMFSAMLTDAFTDSDAGFPIRYRFDGNLFKFNSRQMCWTSSSKHDRMAENARTETKMQGAMDRVSEACDNYDLTISLISKGVDQ